jgi:hypothetical protein
MDGRFELYGIIKSLEEVAGMGRWLVFPLCSRSLQLYRI